MKHKVWLFLSLLASVATGPGVRAVESSIDTSNRYVKKYFSHMCALRKIAFDHVINKDLVDLERQKNQSRSEEITAANKALWKSIKKRRNASTVAQLFSKADQWGRNRAILLLGQHRTHYTDRVQHQERWNDVGYFENIHDFLKINCKDYYKPDEFVGNILLNFSSERSTIYYNHIAKICEDFPLSISVLEKAAVFFTLKQICLDNTNKLLKRIEEDCSPETLEIIKAVNMYYGHSYYTENNANRMEYISVNDIDDLIQYSKLSIKADSEKNKPNEEFCKKIFFLEEPFSDCSDDDIDCVDDSNILNGNAYFEKIDLISSDYLQKKASDIKNKTNGKIAEFRREVALTKKNDSPNNLLESIKDRLDNNHIIGKILDSDQYNLDDALIMGFRKKIKDNNEPDQNFSNYFNKIKKFFKQKASPAAKNIFIHSALVSTEDADRAELALDFIDESTDSNILLHCIVAQKKMREINKEKKVDYNEKTLEHLINLYYERQGKNDKVCSDPNFINFLFSLENPEIRKSLQIV